MKYTLDDLAAIVALMRRHHVTTLDEQSGEEKLFLRLMSEEAPSSSIPAAPPKLIPLRSPEMGTVHPRPGIVDGDKVRRGDIVAFVFVDAIKLPVIAQASGVLRLKPRPPNTPVGYRETLGKILP